MIRQLILASVLVAVLPFREGGAQARQPTMPPVFRSDSTAWQRVLLHVVSSLSTHMLRTASDTARQPWRISLPANAPQREMLEAHLRTILRARPVQSSDSVVYELEFGPFTVTNDTGRVRVRTDFATRCRNSSASSGFGNVEDVYIVLNREVGAWGMARGGSVMHGDRAPCPR